MMTASPSSQGLKGRTPRHSRQHKTKQAVVSVPPDPVYISPHLWDVMDKTVSCIEHGYGSVSIHVPKGGGRTSLVQFLFHRLKQAYIPFILEESLLHNLPDLIHSLSEGLFYAFREKNIHQPPLDDPLDYIGHCLKHCMDEGLSLCFLIDDPETISEDVCDFLLSLLEFKSEINGQSVYETSVTKFILIGDQHTLKPWKGIIEAYHESLTEFFLPSLDFSEAVSYIRMRLKPLSIHPHIDPFTPEVAEEIFLVTQGLIKKLSILMNYAVLFMKPYKGRVLCPHLLNHILQSILEVNPDFLTPLPPSTLSPFSDQGKGSFLQKLMALFKNKS
jgi:hypothetical protein